jgi:hypothetical protein
MRDGRLSEKRANSVATALPMSSFADIQTFWDEIAARPSGPMAFRFYLQPTMAALLALRDGIKDAREGDAPYFWTILNDPAHRRSSVQEGVLATARVIILGVVMDVIYQYFVLDAFRPTELVFIVLLLCFLPYLVLRGAFTRVARAWIGTRGSR